MKTYTIREKIERSGSYSRKKIFGVYDENGKCVAFNCAKKDAQMFIHATEGLENINFVYAKLMKMGTSNGADILARIAAKDLATELKTLMQ